MLRMGGPVTEVSGERGRVTVPGHRTDDDSRGPLLLIRRRAR